MPAGLISGFTADASIPQASSSSMNTTRCPAWPEFSTLDLLGMKGLVCATSVKPSVLNISPCCTPDRPVRVMHNCTQYCEVAQSPNSNHFEICLRDLNGGKTLSSVCEIYQDLVPVPPYGLSTISLAIVGALGYLMILTYVLLWRKRELVAKQALKEENQQLREERNSIIAFRQPSYGTAEQRSG